MDEQLVFDAKDGAGAPATLAQIRAGSYYDSIVLMQLQRALAALPGVQDAGVIMGTPANKELLVQSGLLTNEVEQAAPEDLVLIVRAQSAHAAQAALGKVDDLLAARRSQHGGAYRPKTLAAGARMAPEAEWVLISVPGRHAAAVARDALDLGKNVFLYSDNVTLEEESALKEIAAGKGLMMMGPDCGTARVDGVGLGFANRVRRGRIGIVAASGTGLQAVMAGIHRLGAGVSQAYGTGGRDLSAEVKARTAKHCLSRLAEDPGTDGIIIVSKPPAATVAQELLAAASACEKPVVVHFIGFEETASQPGHSICPDSGRVRRTGGRPDRARQLEMHERRALSHVLTRRAVAAHSGPAVEHLPARALLRRHSGLRSALHLAGHAAIATVQHAAARWPTAG